MILQASLQDTRGCTYHEDNVRGRSTFGEEKFKLGQNPVVRIARKQARRLPDDIADLRDRETVIREEAQN